jgi:membrane protease YdiL (CAAX protease family)
MLTKPSSQHVTAGLRSVAGLFVGSSVFAIAAAAVFGGAAGSRLDLLLQLALQQIVVVLGLTAFFARTDGLVFRDVVGRLNRPALWLVAAGSGALGLAFLQSPLLDQWAAALGYEPPAWWAMVVQLGDPASAALTVVSVCLIPSIAEEAFFRGYLQSRFLSLGVMAAITLQAVLFAAFHLDPFGLPVYLVSGLLLGGVRHWSGSVWPGVAAHFINNLVGIVEIDRGRSAFEAFGVSALLIGGVAFLLAGALIRFLWNLERGVVTTTRSL